MDQSAAGGHPLHVAWQNRAFMPLIVVVIDAALDDIGHGLDSSVRVLAENTAREPILHQRQERIRGCEIPPHRRRHQRPDAMMWRHSLLKIRSVDPEDGSFDSSHGHSLLRSSARHIGSGAVVVESDPNAKSRPGSMPGLWRPRPLVRLWSSALSEVSAGKRNECQGPGRPCRLSEFSRAFAAGFGPSSNSAPTKCSGWRATRPSQAATLGAQVWITTNAPSVQRGVGAPVSCHSFSRPYQLTARPWSDWPGRP